MYEDRDYRVIEKSSINALEHDIHHWMHTHGWVPIGGISVVAHPGAPTMYVQAIVNPKVVQAGVPAAQPVGANEFLDVPAFLRKQAE